MVSYGFGNSAQKPMPYSPEQLRDREEREAQEAYNRWIAEQGLLLQLLGQGQQNANQEIFNANQLASAKQGAASTRYGLGRDAFQSELGLARGRVDLGQMGLSRARMENDVKQWVEQNRRYGLGLDMDLARARGQERAGDASLAGGMFRR